MTITIRTPVDAQRKDWPRLVAEDLRKVRNAAITSSSAVSAAYTVKSSDKVLLVDASGGGVTLTLPAAASAKNSDVTIKKTDTTGNAVTIDGNGSETIDGGLTAVIVTPYVALRLYCDGTEWWIV